MGICAPGRLAVGSFGVIAPSRLLSCSSVLGALRVRQFAPPLASARMLAEMMNQAEPWIAVATAASEQRAAELGLVLTALGIEHQRQAGGAGWEIWVPAARAGEASGELAQYVDENRRAIGQRSVEEVGGALPGVAAYVAILVAVFACVHASAWYLDWYGAGRLEAGSVVRGEWWRTITALTVHLELDHLGGNLAFGSFFGYFVGRHLGRGVGWFAIVASGAVANALNAIVQAPGHRSIGASTAVFAALGLLTAYTWRRGFMRETPWRGRIAPIIAGIGLLAFTGTAGENTDLTAHLFGFMAGFGAGLALARWARIDWLRSRRRQAVYAGAALAAVAAAWAWGLLASG
jgi:membrane associated rhomboid family serine protease